MLIIPCVAAGAVLPDLLQLLRLLKLAPVADVQNPAVRIRHAQPRQLVQNPCGKRLRTARIVRQRGGVQRKLLRKIHPPPVVDSAGKAKKPDPHQHHLFAVRLPQQIPDFAVLKQIRRHLDPPKFSHTVFLIRSGRFPPEKTIPVKKIHPNPAKETGNTATILFDSAVFSCPRGAGNSPP